MKKLVYISLSDTLRIHSTREILQFQHLLDAVAKQTIVLYDIFSVTTINGGVTKGMFYNVQNRIELTNITR